MKLLKQKKTFNDVRQRNKIEQSGLEDKLVHDLDWNRERIKIEVANYFQKTHDEHYDLGWEGSLGNHLEKKPMAE